MRLQLSLSCNAGADSGAPWNQGKRGSAESQQQRTVPTVPSEFTRMHASRDRSSRTDQPHGLRNSRAPVREFLVVRDRLPPNDRPSRWRKSTAGRHAHGGAAASSYWFSHQSHCRVCLGAVIDSERPASRTPTMSFNCTIPKLLLQERILGEGSYGLQIRN